MYYFFFQVEWINIILGIIANIKVASGEEN